MSKLASYRHKDQFVVTVSIACPLCLVLKPEKDVTKRSRYINYVGQVEQVGCTQCWDKRIKEAEAEKLAKMAVVSQGGGY